MKPLPISSRPCWIIEVPGSVRAGFPTPQEDYGHKALDIAGQLIQHPQATFVMRCKGESMVDAGIFDGDYVVVDRAIKPMPGHIVVAVLDGDFTLKYLRNRSGRVFLEAANPTFPPIYPKDGSTLEIWGVATNTIHPLPGTARWQ
ncbi:translesion error-prone DNA polymerase V autoproteolytic subunit (plasmid) [Comamonas aquatica]|nr:translesion error-prone DNA polymerase V autoproteolytic subunit [Comamonas aquatica]